MIKNSLLFLAMVGLEIRPIAKLYYKRTEGLPTDGKGGRKEDIITLVKARGSQRGNAMEIITS